MKGEIGGSKPVELYKNKIYTFEEIKSLAVKTIKSEINKSYFKNAIIEIGSFGGTVWKNFTNEEGQLCDFWNFVPIKNRARGSDIRVYVLTTTIRSKPLAGTELEEKSKNNF